MKRLFVIIILTFFITLLSFGQNAWINELHYDNVGTDAGEFIEVVIENPGSYSLSLFEVVLYNGSGGALYDSKTVDAFTVGITEGNYTFYTFTYSTNGIQNGAPDGLALVYNGSVIQFLSYERAFIATNGAASGISSIDIGVSESNSTPVGHSLQLTGSGSSYIDFSWVFPAPNTLGSLNNGQSFSGIPNPDNPSSFVATAIPSQEIILTWFQNTDNDDVMIAYSLSGTFGVPLNGTGYNTSDLISGGGEVIYNGPLSTFIHTSLISNTQYFYRAWSVDASVSYSSGVSDDATTAVNPDLIISEVADPEDPGTPPDDAKFIELFNGGNSTINFSTDTWYISRQANGDPASWADVQLTGSIDAGETYVIGYYSSAFQSAYGFNADQYNSNMSGNGDDVYALYSGGDHASGVLIDLFGEIDVDGTNSMWEYEDSKAVRKRHITSPSNVWLDDEWVIIPAIVQISTGENQCTPDWHDRDLTWEGNSSDWSDENNWTNSGTSPRKYPPDAGCDIVIPNLANDPIISGRASTNNMEIEPGAVVTVTPTNFLVTGSEIDNQSGTSGLIVKSDASSDGMLLLGSGTTQATIERYLTDDKSHFISAPTTNATADDLFQDHNPEVYLYEFHESDETYHYLVPTSTPMPSGKGFSTWVEDFTPDYIVAEFDGNLMSSDLTLNTSTTPAMSYTYIAPPNDTLGYNLLGNPYPIPISWKKGSWAKNNVEYTIWIWEPFPDATADEPDGQWLVTTTSGGGNFNGVVPSGQAFLVRASASGPSITIPADARTVYYPSTTYYKTRENDNDSSTYEADYVTIKAMNDQDEEEIWISFNEYGTEEFDNGWDASKLRNSYSTITLFIPKESRDHCIEHLPTLLPDEERIVEIGFETTAEGEHSIMIDATYLPDTDITLEDMKYDQMQNMDSDSIYTFVAFADDDPNRFRIHFNKTITGIEFEDFNHYNDESIQIYSYGKHVYIKKEDISSSGYVMLYDMYGREVLSQLIEQTSLMKIPVQLNNSYLVVKVISDSKVFTSKVYIK